MSLADGAPDLWADRAVALRRDGYCLLPRLLQPDFVSRLRTAADAAAEAWSAGREAAVRAQGSMVGVPELHDPIFGELIAHEPVLEALDRLGLSGMTFTDGYVISKPG